MSAYGPEADIACACGPSVREIRLRDRDGRERCTNCFGLVGTQAIPRRVFTASAETERRSAEPVDDPEDSASYREARAMMRYGRR